MKPNKTNKKNNCIVAIDFGGSRARVVLTNSQIKNLGEMAIYLAGGMSHSKLNNLVYDSIKKLVKNKIPKNKIKGVALASAGIPDDKKLILTKAPNMPKSLNGEIRILPFLRQKLNIKKFSILNDCSAAAYASYFFSKNPKVVVYWTLSSGTNIGVVVDGKLFNGQYATTPEFGHMSVFGKDIFGNRLVCNCGGYGHLEAGVSGNGIANMLLNAVKTKSITQNSILYKKIKKLRMDSKNIYDLKQKLPITLLNSNDAYSKKLKEFIAENIAKSLGILISLYGAGKIEIGGALTNAHRQIISPAIKLIKDNKNNNYYLQNKKNIPLIRIAKNFGRDYPWQGAALAWMEK